jgi:Rha family phage regulatory protein
MNHDLFPETLLVEQRAGQIFTTSLKVAEHFQKQHKDVLKALKRLLADCPDKAFAERNFALSKYQVTGGKNSIRDEEMYTMSEEGFAILAMGFTGPKALQWKIDFLNAFRSMEAAVKAQTQREAAALFNLRPHWKTIGEGVLAEMTRLQICQLTGHKSPDTITANKRRMRDAGLIH